jgi:hypothetical protein
MKQIIGKIKDNGKGIFSIIVLAVLSNSIWVKNYFYICTLLEIIFGGEMKL